MKTLTVAEFKARFSEVADDLKQGKKIAVTYGRNKKLLGTFVPASALPGPNYSIEIGDLQKRGWTYKMRNFEMTDEELLGS